MFFAVKEGHAFVLYHVYELVQCVKYYDEHIQMVENCLVITPTKYNLL